MLIPLRQSRTVVHLFLLKTLNFIVKYSSTAAGRYTWLLHVVSQLISLLVVKRLKPLMNSLVICCARLLFASFLARTEGLYFNAVVFLSTHDDRQSVDRQTDTHRAVTYTALAYRRAGKNWSILCWWWLDLIARFFHCYNQTVVWHLYAFKVPPHLKSVAALPCVFSSRWQRFFCIIPACYNAGQTGCERCEIFWLAASRNWTCLIAN